MSLKTLSSVHLFTHEGYLIFKSVDNLRKLCLNKLYPGKPPSQTQVFVFFSMISQDLRSVYLKWPLENLFYSCFKLIVWAAVELGYNNLRYNESLHIRTHCPWQLKIEEN